MLHESANDYRLNKRERRRQIYEKKGFKIIKLSVCLCIYKRTKKNLKVCCCLKIGEGLVCVCYVQLIKKKEQKLMFGLCPNKQMYAYYSRPT